MSIATLTIIFFCAIILGLATGLPIAFVLGGLSMLFASFLWGPEAMFLSVTAAFSSIFNFVLLAVPLFIFMGFTLQKSGVTEALFNSLRLWVGRINGGLAMGTVIICTIIAAMVGIISAGIITAVIIALPEMLRHHYDKRLAYGTIMAGGCLGMLIPPSIHMILYASIARQSVGKMLIGGLFPGLILAGLYITYIGIRTGLNPSLGLGLRPEETASWRQKFASLKSLIMPLFIIFSVLGTIFFGVATPTEAADIGCIGAIICAALHHRLNWQLLKEVTIETTKIFAMVMWILIGASCFTRFYVSMGATDLIQGLVFGAAVNPWFIIIAMQLILIGLGMIMEDLAIILIAAPMFTPMVTELGFDPLWFGIVFIVNLQIAMLSPPYGFANFFMKGMLPEERMATFYRSTLPFIGLQIIGLAIVMAFPQVVLWLPNLMIGA